ncbi:unnamed protein product [Ilex paraguariensis]|uniref:Uncharacterized protein n=1 Tax=Ilex paraguariensis TaxID=185542 RepID=A0ABC8UV77_9AQUA
MMSLSNGVLYDGSSNKRPLDDGYHPFSLNSFQPMFKSRKFSAVRDFPPGCGRNASLIDVNSHENAVLVDDNKMSNVVEVDCVKSSRIMVESQSLEVVKRPAREEMDEALDDSGEQVLAAAGMVNKVKNEKLGTDVKPLGIGLPKSLENNAVVLANELRRSDGQVLVNKESNEVEGLASVPKESTELGGSDLVKSEGPVDEKPSLEIGAFTDRMVQGGGAKSWSPSHWPISNGKVGIEAAPSPKSMYYRRRVSATRDFPPFCGRNAPQPAAEDCLRINSRNRSLDVAIRFDGPARAKETLKASVKRGSETVALKNGIEELYRDVGDGYFEKNRLKGIVPEQRNNYKAAIGKSNEDASGSLGELRKKITGLMVAPFCRWRQGRGALTTSDSVMSRGKVNKHGFTTQPKSILVSRSNYETHHGGGKSMKEKSVTAAKAAYESTGTLVVRDEEDSVVHYEEKLVDYPVGQMPNDVEVSLPPFGPNSSSHGDARDRVRETLRLFQAIFRKLLQGEEAKSRQGREIKLKRKETEGKFRIDLLAAGVIKRKRKEVNTSSQILGAVPGVEVGDEFQYRVELAIIGVHRLYQSGIDYMNHDGVIVATSIVASGAYADDLDNANVLIYSGQGGNVVRKNKEPEDQKLVRGNLALKNSISVKNPVRVIRGSKGTKASDSLDARAKVVKSYVYDGLYTAEKYWTETGPHGKLVFMFVLRRNAGQPELAWQQVKKSNKYKIREGLCVDDISGGKESFPIGAVNTVDSGKPPTFNYVTRMRYRDWYCPITPKGCDCKGGCSDSQKCSCAVKNGGEIPYNYSGAIVEAKPLVYECGPSCKCPPSCYNRVSQHGINIQLEIFKTESRGWGVRSLAFIPSGSFICEYAGELLEDKEAEQRIGNDEYLFDIGQNYNDGSHNLDAHSSLCMVMEDGGYTIDAAQYGNVGRFINHCCSPNLYAQNVLYDNEDRRMPHIMLFAAENIPPLQELTYHYNYSVDQIHDSNGNIKMKSCYCGSAQCTGRMY